MRTVVEHKSPLQQTVRVAADGTVTRGIEVPHRGGARVVAAPPASHRHRRFAPGGVPKGVRLDLTIPHDCANHLPDVAAVAEFADHAEEVAR